MSNIDCNQCEAMMINNVFCHEPGCPNESKVWNPEEESWQDEELENEDY